MQHFVHVTMPYGHMHGCPVINRHARGRRLSCCRCCKANLNVFLSTLQDCKVNGMVRWLFLMREFFLDIVIHDMIIQYDMGIH